MVRRVLLFGLFIGLFFAAHVAGSDSGITYFALFSLSALFVFYFLLVEDALLFYLSLVLATASLGSRGLIYSSPWPFVLLGGLVSALSACFYFRWDWHRAIADSAVKKQTSAEEVVELQRKFDDREGSFKTMAQQLNDIAYLYELAKWLNECLSMEELVETLRARFFGNVMFQQATLLVFADETEPPSIVRKFTIYQGVKPEDDEAKTDLTSFEKKVILEMYESKEAVQKQSAQEPGPDWFAGEEVHYPCWVFPLVVQEKVIAIFVVEGADKDDFPGFQVIASQLALQVKKIKLYDTVRELSIVDGLTRVFVRRHFLERFEEELRRSLRHGFHLAVLMLDIDHFKSYNDNYGHLVGDVTLREVSQVILSTVRRVDIVSRFGGEEFAVVLPETDKKGASEVAERIRSAVAKKRFKVYDEETKVTVSIGVSAFPSDLETPSESYKSDLIAELLRKADQALYQAKEEGRNRVIAFEKHDGTNH